LKIHYLTLIKTLIWSMLHNLSLLF